MNCPNCGEKPADLSYILTGNDFDLKTRMQGYLRCQHCDAMLGDQKTFMGIRKFHPNYHIFTILAVVLVGVGSFYLFDFYDTHNVSSWIYFGTLGLILLAIVVGFTALSDRYRILKEVTQEEIEADPKKLTAKGLAVFGVYLVTVLGLFLAINKYVDMRELGFVVYLVFQLMYLIAVMFGASYLLKKFENNGNNSQQNEPAQS